MRNKDLIRQYISTGNFLKPLQFDHLSNSEKKTYIKTRMNHFLITSGDHIRLLPYEWMILNEEQKKELLLTGKQFAPVIRRLFTNEQLLSYISNLLDFVKIRKFSISIKNIFSPIIKNKNNSYEII